ncbi:MAG: hypothetical protein Fur0011_5800 [Candidatus Microgenomates bacterium]
MTLPKNTQHITLFIKHNFEAILFIALLTLVFLYAFMGMQKHYHFQTFGWDTAVFDQQIYLITKGQSPYSSLLNMHGLGDHFQILTYVFGSLGYLIWSSANMLFIIQAIAGCLSAIPLYLLGKRLFTKYFSIPKAQLVSAIVSGMYLLAVPFQAMMVDEFHNEPLALAPLLFAFYFIETRQWRPYWISFILFLLNKEVFGLFSIPISIYLYLKTKNLKQSLLTLIVGLGLSVLLITTIMPGLAGSNSYLHFKPGNTPSEMIQTYLANPSLFITSLYDSPAKQRTITSSFMVFGLLPLLAPLALIAPVFSIALRFYDTSVPILHEFNNHFAAPLIPFMAVAAVYGLSHILAYMKKTGKLKYYWVLCIILLLTILYQDYYYHGPLNSLAKPSFYQTQQWELNAHELIQQVPKDIVVATQNSLLPHLSQRPSFYLLPKVGDAEYIAVDLTDGANKFYRSNLSSTNEMIQELIVQQKYQVIWNQGKSYLLKKHSTSTEPLPVLRP